MAQFDPNELLIHHAKHQSEFPECTPAQYERLADTFLRRASSVDLKECNRKKGDLIRYDMLTNEYAVLSSAGVIRTYFKPVPCASLAPAVRAGCHGHATNLDYFSYECRNER